MSKTAAKRIVKRAYVVRMAERSFVKEVLERKVTPEVEAFTAAASARSHSVRNAPFLSRFRKSHATA